ncbi:Unknown protein [Striga hermonthica]|uniref:Uncharacterized protein n=1 Tax=Striga hermonthica TaxID=68872 RepID=A0A9N7RAY3_STRHE|nr:Unknown protein [Striga hermonthica]
MPTRVLNNGWETNVVSEDTEKGGMFVEKRLVFNKDNGKKSIILNNHNYYVDDDDDDDDDDGSSSSSSSSSSSIGKNSDLSMEKSGDGEEEIQSSSDKGAAMEAAAALEEVLPIIRRGISSFYNGKSKSFASLAHASSSSIKDIAKPDNAYARKRRNVLSCSLNIKNRNLSYLKSNSGGISKKTAGAGRGTTLALGVAMSKNSESGNKSCEGWRSFSLAADLQHCVSVGENNSSLDSH